MTLRELNEGISLKDIKSKVKVIKTSVTDKAKEIGKTLKDEFNDNKAAFGIFKKSIKGKFGGEKPTPEEFQKAIEQMKDNVRLTVIGAIGAAPGSALTLPLTFKIAKKMGITLAPSKTF